jgi:hypothetical protein
VRTVDLTAASSRSPLMQVMLAEAIPPPRARSIAGPEDGTRNLVFSRRSWRASSSEASVGFGAVIYRAVGDPSVHNSWHVDTSLCLWLVGWFWGGLSRVEGVGASRRRVIEPKPSPSK